MQTLNLIQAAEFLKMHPEALRRKAKAGQIPGRKTGKQWLFVKQHLADWISGRYPEHGRELRVINGGKLTKEDNKPCQSINAAKVKPIGLTSQTQTATEYAKLLAHKTKNKRNNCMTN